MYDKVCDMLIQLHSQARVDSGRGQNRTPTLLAALRAPVFASEQDVGPPKGRYVGQGLGLDYPFVPAGAVLSARATLYDPGGPMGRMFFNILATFAEFQADLIRMRTREGMAIARNKGKLRGKQPRLSDR